ncbi:MAG: sensor histidine kinase [Actinobacteria bacterium]|nr:sensor histidine kinase [Actinomycetota bacterium]
MTPADDASFRTGPLPVIPSERRSDPVALAQVRGRLSGDRKRHLEQLIAEWHILADFCFSDLLLFVPVDESDDRFLVVGQVRPSTSQTLYRTDLIGLECGEADRPLVHRCFRLGQIIDGEYLVEHLHEFIREVCIPVRFEGQVIAVLARETPTVIGRAHGELERVYAEIFNDFARMITQGDYPFDQPDSGSDELPRVGDGVLVLDGEARISYISPNAVSAMHRIGVHANTEGMTLAELGIDDEMVRSAFDVRRPATVEIERTDDVIVLLHCIPIIGRDTVEGAVVLARDISELRRRDRLLLSKDATIREIHHRVKNNLQTVSALLHLQGRRLASEEAKSAIDESVRRIHSIALVHDMLARAAGDDVPFVDIVRPLVRMVEEGLVAPEQRVTFRVEGDGGIPPAEVVTPLAVVLNELLQNAVDHAFGVDGGEVVVDLSNSGDRMEVRVSDDGRGLPAEFDIKTAKGLGLSIVRALVVSDLSGSISAMSPRSGGTVVALSVPLHGR